MKKTLGAKPTRASRARSTKTGSPRIRPKPPSRKRKAKASGPPKLLDSIKPLEVIRGLAFGDLSPMAKHVGIMLVLRTTNATAVAAGAAASIPGLCAISGRGRTAVKKALNELVEKQLLERRRTLFTNVYRWTEKVLGSRSRDAIAGSRVVVLAPPPSQTSAAIGGAAGPEGYGPREAHRDHARARGAEEARTLEARPVTIVDELIEAHGAARIERYGEVAPTSTTLPPASTLDRLQNTAASILASFPSASIETVLLTMMRAYLATDASKDDYLDRSKHSLSGVGMHIDAIELAARRRLSKACQAAGNSSSQPGAPAARLELESDPETRRSTRPPLLRAGLAAFASQCRQLTQAVGGAA